MIEPQELVSIRFHERPNPLGDGVEISCELEPSGLRHLFRISQIISGHELVAGLTERRTVARSSMAARLMANFVFWCQSGKPMPIPTAEDG